MLRDSRRCRRGEPRTNFHSIYRAYCRDLMKAEDYEALSMQESMRGHMWVMKRGYEPKYYDRRQAITGLRRLLKNSVGQDFDVVCNKVRFAFKEANCSRDEILRSLSWETEARLPWSVPDFGVIDGKLVEVEKESRKARRRRALKVKARIVKTNARNTAFVKADGLWYLAEFKDASSFVKQEAYYDSVADKFRPINVYMRDLIGNYTQSNRSKVWDYSCNGSWDNPFIYSMKPVNHRDLNKIRKVIEESAHLGWVEDEVGFNRCSHRSTRMY